MGFKISPSTTVDVCLELSDHLFPYPLFWQVIAHIQRNHPHRQTTQMDDEGYTFSKFRKHKFCGSRTGRFRYG